MIQFNLNEKPVIRPRKTNDHIVHNNHNKISLKKTIIDKFTIAHWNANAISNKVYMLKEYIKANDPDAISINETWLDDQHANFTFSEFPGYNTVYKCRKDRMGGGVAIMMKKHINYARVTQVESEFSEQEVVGVKIEADSFHFYIFSYYSPPLNTISNEMLNWIESNHANFILLGDLNAKARGLGCLADHDNHSGRVLEEFLDNSHCTMLNHGLGPTYRAHSGCSTEQLDYIIATPSLATKLAAANNSFDSPLDSDHSVLSFTFRIATPLSPSSALSSPRFNYAKADWSKFAAALSNPVHDLTAAISDINFMESQIVEAILEAKSIAIPVRKSFFNSEKPSDFVKLVREKRRARRKKQKSNSPEDIREYNRLAKEVKAKSKELSKESWTKFIDRVGPRPTSSAPFWQRINRFRNKPESNTIATIVHNNTSCSNDMDKAQAFADHLSKVFSTDPLNNFDDNHKATIERFVKETELPPPTARELFTLDELNYAIKSLNNKISNDKHGLCNRLLKNVPDPFKLILLELFNKCLISGEQPESWKMSQIMLIRKKDGDISNVKSYRPISITPYLSKLNERLVLNRLVNFLTANNSLVSFQSGFRKHRQTKDNILFIVQKVLESFNRNIGKSNKLKWRVCGVFFDIAAAFDKVWHAGLIYKLIKLNVPTHITRWIQSFLEDRAFVVKVNDAISGAQPIECGVPQGSVLSPILFSIFINDIPARANKNKNQSLLFADDLCHLELFNRHTQAEENINLLLVELNAWLVKWRLKMAPHKCAYVLFNNCTQAPDLNIYLGDARICRAKETTFLGVVLDEKLSFDKHLDKIRQACKSRANIIKIVAHPSWKLDLVTLKQLYFSLVRSLFEYSSILTPALTQSRIGSLQVIQNTALRSMLRLPKGTFLGTLHRLAGVSKLADRLSLLSSRYLGNSIINSNPLVTTLYQEFLAFGNGRTRRKATLLDPHLAALELANIISHLATTTTTLQR